MADSPAPPPEIHFDRWYIVDRGRAFVPTGALRLLEPAHALQQEWYCHETGTTEWRDVPVVKG